MIELDRVKREKGWHNETFGTDVRAKVGKFYSLFYLLSNEFDAIINEDLQNKTTVFMDYGCGTGSYLVNIASKIKKGIGIDISEERINEAKKIIKEKNIDNLEFMVMDAMNTSFESGCFNIIHGSAILHHLDLEKSLIEIKRLLIGGGAAFFIEPLDTNLLIKFYRKVTPKARTFDEQPLRKKDIKLIKLLFPEAEINYYFFFSLLAVPFRKNKIFNKMLEVLYFIDKTILNKKSPFKWLAWTCSIILKKENVK
jgi:ubiquinone/menaquinone biosynthesis C-methylase UbiE